MLLLHMLHKIPAVTHITVINLTALSLFTLHVVAHSFSQSSLATSCCTSPTSGPLGSHFLSPCLAHQAASKPAGTQSCLCGQSLTPLETLEGRNHPIAMPSECQTAACCRESEVRDEC